MAKKKPLTLKQRAAGLSLEDRRALISLLQAPIGAIPGRKKKTVEALALLLLEIHLTELGLGRWEIHERLANKPGIPGTVRGVENLLSRMSKPVNVAAAALTRSGASVPLNLPTLRIDAPDWILSEQGLRDLSVLRAGSRRRRTAPARITITPEMVSESVKKAKEILALITEIKP